MSLLNRGFKFVIPHAGLFSIEFHFTIISYYVAKILGFWHWLHLLSLKVGEARREAYFHFLGLFTLNCVYDGSLAVGAAFEMRRVDVRRWQFVVHLGQVGSSSASHRNRRSSWVVVTWGALRYDQWQYVSYLGGDRKRRKLIPSVHFRNSTYPHIA